LYQEKTCQLTHVSKKNTNTSEVGGSSVWQISN
jgi:hypothetical protein